MRQRLNHIRRRNEWRWEDQVIHANLPRQLMSFCQGPTQEGPIPLWLELREICELLGLA